MDILRTFLEQQPLLSMFLVIGIGYALGGVNIRGFVPDRNHYEDPAFAGNAGDDGETMSHTVDISADEALLRTIIYDAFGSGAPT